MSSLLYQNQNTNDLKRVNDSMSEKIKQNQKQKVLFQNNIGSNITSGINTEKRITNNYNNNNLEELNNINNNISGSLGRNVSQSSLSVDLSRFKINPNNFNNFNNNFNNSKIKLKLNQNENFETFNPENNNYVSVNNSNENIEINNLNNENNNNININENKIEEKKNNMNSLLKNFNPYDIKNYLGDKAQPKKIKKNKLTFINNIPPSTSNLQMILYNKKIEDYNKKNNPDYIFKEFYQKESRRMLVEYLKIYKDENITLKDFMKNENIHPLVLLLKDKPDEQSSIINNKSNINDENINISYLNKDISNKTFSKSESSNKKDLLGNNPSKKNFKNVNSFKILSAFLNDVNDEAQEKSLLMFLSIPRILSLISSGEKLSCLFCSSPTNISCTYGIETYIFKWNDCKNYNLIGYFDLINVENCFVNPGNKKRFDIYISLGKKNNKENNKVNEESYYCIETNQEEIAQNYVQAINFVSQLIKYRVYLKQKKEGKLTNYSYIFN